MDRLTLVSSLREALWDVSLRGGDRTVFFSLPEVDVSILRSFFYSYAKDKVLQIEAGRQARVALDDILDRDRFEKRISFCLLSLRDSGVPPEEQAGFLREALRRQIDAIFSPIQTRAARALDSAKPESTKEIIIARLDRCFSPGYYPEFILVYELLREHQFVVWDFELSRWRLTNLGHYALRLGSFSFLSFLLALDVCFGSSSKRFSRYPNEATLARLSKEGALDAYQYPIALKWYGVVDREESDSNQRSDKARLTDFGDRLVERVLDRLEYLKDTVLLLVETEDRGFRFGEGSGRITSMRKVMECSPLLSKVDKSGLAQVLELQGQGKWLSALRQFYPTIESFLTGLLTRYGISSPELLGMKVKLRELKKCGAISDGFADWAEIVASRNKIVHGNLSDDQDDLLPPLFDLVAGFWCSLLDDAESRFLKVSQPQ
ncbi:MAG TPA: hypothetical protein VF173_09975 [Thermoanaerobaculia bacterium]|nr:hypothetical protein [Thermoanaerobaculia bacterium]